MKFGTLNKLHLYFQLSETTCCLICFHGNNSQINDITGGRQLGFLNFQILFKFSLLFLKLTGKQHLAVKIHEMATISDNNIGQWLPFPPYPLPNVVLQVQKKYPKKSRHHCSNIERGEAGKGFLLRVARDFWLGLYSLYMLGISMGLFQACHVIDFQKDIIKTA